MPTPPINVLFLCTGNSARSILSEALLNDLAAENGKSWLGWSAGSHPSGAPHPDGLKELQRRGHQTAKYRSKSWDEFSGADALIMDIIVTVCDNAANEVCPVFPGHGFTPERARQGIRVHWPAPDPAHIEPLAARQKAFSDVYDLCRARIETLLSLPEEDLTQRDKIQSIAKIKA